MDMILICRDGMENSVIGSVAMAMEAKKAGQEVGIIFTEEALACLGGQAAFRWSPGFRDRYSRINALRNATAMGMETGNPKDARWSDLSRLLKQAKGAGVNLMACPIWSQILAVDGNLPPEVAPIDRPTLLKELQQAKVILGGY